MMVNLLKMVMVQLEKVVMVVLPLVVVEAVEVDKEII
jgi:hypothetical protein